MLLYIQESILIGMMTFQGCDRRVGGRWDIKIFKDINETWKYESVELIPLAVLQHNGGS